MTSLNLIDIRGACHCGNVRIHLRWPEPEDAIPVRRCGCTFCRKHGGVWTSNRNAQLEVAIDDMSRMSKYRFGTATADFYVCSICGIAPVVVCEIDERHYAVVNVNSFENTESLNISESSTDFDGEDISSRLDRRKRNWIPNVRIA